MELALADHFRRATGRGNAFLLFLSDLSVACHAIDHGMLLATYLGQNRSRAVLIFVREYVTECVTGEQPLRSLPCATDYYFYSHAV